MKKYLLVLILQFSFFSLNSFAQTRLSGGQSYGWYVIDPVSISGTPDFSDVFFTDDNTGWITSSSTNNIYKTADGTASFSTQITTLTTNAVHMVDASTGFSGGASGFVYSTIDGGLTWPFFGTISNTLTDIDFATTTQGYTCGFNGTIYSITPGGLSPMTSQYRNNKPGIHNLPDSNGRLGLRRGGYSALFRWHLEYRSNSSFWQL